MSTLGTAVSAGHVDVGALNMYYEQHGHGEPLVLLHGALGTIESCFTGLLPRLAQHFDVITPEFQGHGHTPDVARPLSYSALARDIAGLLDALSLEHAHIVGYSLGGAVALQLAGERPDLVDTLVYAGGVDYDSDAGQYPEVTAAFAGEQDPCALDGSPWHEAYLRVAPDPDGWRTLVTKMNDLDRTGFRLDEGRLASFERPSLLIAGDADLVRPEHTVKLFRLLGGGVPGDLTGLPRAQLAVLPGTTHVGLLNRTDWLASMIVAFLEHAATA